MVKKSSSEVKFTWLRNLSDKALEDEIEEKDLMEEDLEYSLQIGQGFEFRVFSRTLYSWIWGLYHDGKTILEFEEEDSKTPREMIEAAQSFILLIKHLSSIPQKKKIRFQMSKKEELILEEL